MKVVKEATVEIVKLKDLEVGDHILYSNLKCLVIELPSTRSLIMQLHPMDEHGRLKVQQFPDDPKSTMHIGPFRTYYKIKNAELMDACLWCGKEIPEESDKDVCEGCYIEQIMGNPTNPENGESWTEEEIQEELNNLKASEAEQFDQYR